MIPDKLVANATMPEIIILKTANKGATGSITSPPPVNNVKNDRVISKTANINPIRMARKDLELYFRSILLKSSSFPCLDSGDGSIFFSLPRLSRPSLDQVDF